MRKITKIIVHVTDSPDTMDIGAKEIRQWHKDRGWSDIGYHKVVRRSGVVEAGRPEDKIGAHAKGYNKYSLGIVWVGRNDIADEQKQALITEILAWVEQYKLSIDDVIGHCEVNSGKTCPNLDMDKFRRLLRQRQEEVKRAQKLADDFISEDTEVDIDDIE